MFGIDLLSLVRSRYEHMRVTELKEGLRELHT